MSEIGIQLNREFTMIPGRGYQMVLFGCGAAYAGWDDIVGPAIKHHEHSGCKGCRRYKRRMEAALRSLALQPRTSASEV